MSAESVILYSYFRSSAAYRVRIALNWKEIPYSLQFVHLVKNGGEQHSPSYKALNPIAEVPCLVHGDVVLSQSMAILQYLDAVWPKKPLFPADAAERARVVQICEIVNSGIHPIQNLKVLQQLESRFHISNDDKKAWAAHWISRGFDGLEGVLEKTAGRFCLGEQLTAADLFVVPQIYNAHRYGVELKNYPHLARIETNALKLEAFQKARPESQPDWV